MRQFHTDMLESSEESHVAHGSAFCIGGVSVGIVGFQSEDVALIPPLEPFRVATGASNNIDIRVEWKPELHQSLARQLFDSGCTWRLYEDDGGFQFDFHVAAFGDLPYKRLLVNSGFSQAILQMNEESFSCGTRRLSPWDYPLDELLIMHRLTREKAIELHGCGIVRRDGTGDLFVGHSGAGKSTTTRLWTEVEDVEILSDDRIIVRQDDVRRLADAPVVDMPCGGAGGGEGLGILRLRGCSGSGINHSAEDDKAQKQIPPLCSTEGRNDQKMRMYGTPWHGEAMYASPGSAPLARIFILEHGRGNVLTRLSPSQGVAELFARSFVPFHKHEYVDSALTFLQEVVGAVPVYRYAFEPDQRAVDTILNFHD
jgi:hypothetical protein